MSAPAITAPGYYEIAADAYHADPAPKPSLSSGLCATIVTETLAQAQIAHPRMGPPKVEEDEKKFDLGSVAHELVLGKGRGIAVLDFDNYTTKAAKEARADALSQGLQPCLAKVHDKASAMKAALFDQLADDPDNMDAFDPACGVSEEAAFWQEQTPLGKMWMRAMMDRRMTNRLAIYDYKTFAPGADPDAFIKNLVGNGRDTQDPFYSRGMAAIASIEAGETIPWDAVTFRWILQHPEPPYLISVVELEPHDRHWAFERSQWAIDRWAAAAGANLYRGFVPRTHYVSVPAWAKSQWEQRMMREYQGEQLMLSDGAPALSLKDPDAYRVEPAE